MRLPAQRHPVAQWLKIMREALRAFFDKGVVRISPTLHRVEPRVDIVPCRRAHRSSLKAALKKHPLRGKPIDMRRLSLASIAPEITEGAIVRHDVDDVGPRLRRKAELTGKERQPSDEKLGRNRHISGFGESYITQRNVTIM